MARSARKVRIDAEEDMTCVVSMKKRAPAAEREHSANETRRDGARSRASLWE